MDFFEEKWDNKYVNPVNFFYEILDKNWTKVSNSRNDFDLKQSLARFRTMVREELSNFWDAQVVERALDLQRKKSELK